MEDEAGAKDGQKKWRMEGDGADTPTQKDMFTWRWQEADGQLNPPLIEILLLGIIVLYFTHYTDTDLAIHIRRQSYAG